MSTRYFTVVKVAYAAQNYSLGDDDRMRRYIEIPEEYEDDMLYGEAALLHRLNNEWEIVSHSSDGAGNESGAYFLHSYVLRSPEGWEPPQ